MTGTLGLHSEAWRTVPSDSRALIFASIHLLARSVGPQNIKMSEKAEISGNNQISIDKEKLKEEHKAELKVLTDAFEQQCLLSFNTNRSGEVVKKFNFLF